MIRYSVTATLNTKDTLHEYYEWLINNQIPAVLNNGAITHELSVVENDQNKEYLINTLYKFPTIEIMNNYLNNIAPNLPSLHDCYVKFYETKKVLNFQRYVGRIEYYYQSSSTKNPLTILPGMIRYNVIATLASIDYLDEYTTWLANGHIQAVVNAGGLAGEYNILHNDDPNIIQVASMYLFPHMDALNSYFNGVATVLRADGIRLFVETNKVLKFERYVGNIRNATNGEDKSLLPVDIAPYLMFNGQCRDAMNFYNSCFEGELQIMDLDSSIPNSKVLHSKLELNRSFAPSTLHASTILASDFVDGFCSHQEFRVGDNMNVSMNFFSYQQIESFYNYLSKDGNISIPLSKQMWGAYFAEFTDRYSINWYLNMMIPPEFSDADTTVNLEKPIVLTPYLRFNGQCEEAMKEYQRILGGSLELNEYPDYPATDAEIRDQNESKRKNIIHSTLTFHEGISIMACDVNRDETQESDLHMGNNVYVSLSFETELAVRSSYYSLSEGGKILNPLSIPFWGGLFGQFVDKYGIQWMVSYHPRRTAES